MIPDNIYNLGLQVVHALQIDSLRAEITLFEAAKAYAAMDTRQAVCVDDLLAVSPMALRLRRSAFMNKYVLERIEEETEISQTIENNLNNIQPGYQP